jgi:hypothetical protein
VVLLLWLVSRIQNEVENEVEIKDRSSLQLGSSTEMGLRLLSRLPVKNVLRWFSCQDATNFVGPMDAKLA